MKRAREKDNGVYHAALRGLQIELVKLQRHLIRHHQKILVLVEGRDGAGKDGAIKAITEHMSPRETRIVALGKPSDRERSEWYFQRYVSHLPAGGEFVLFNRSWYNRAGVERVMVFCNKQECEDFLVAVPIFEDLLVRSGIQLFKYYLDIDRDEQKARLQARRNDPLKQWKISPIDQAALKHWKDYSRARDVMLARTSVTYAPWTIVRANDKPTARLNLIRDLLSRLDYGGKAKPRQIAPDRAIVFPFDRDALRDGRLSA
ncbi:MAG: polyphosphate kinase 2 [Ferrovibrio sp.]|uniref:polyphosphate kinase 2 n=1 Tax=Ferrovibrio sp. TaxID=1917215 RepID=UPI002633132A|nr:polyphosphate kinase 2 [Ferrovibrio sp.]MCW0232433.1 polyphosphate kinase 2 [Ferrovibrio sp.]